MRQWPDLVEYQPELVDGVVVQAVNGGLEGSGFVSDLLSGPAPKLRPSPFAVA